MQERRAKDYTKKGKKLEDCGACLKTDFKMVSYTIQVILYNLI